MGKQVEWLTTRRAAEQVGMSEEWIRQQIVKRRLPATVWDFGGRRTYRIHAEHWRAFLARYSRHTDDPDWE
jgi:excisionase family DNA binding protein